MKLSTGGKIVVSLVCSVVLFKGLSYYILGTPLFTWQISSATGTDGLNFHDYLPVFLWLAMMLGMLCTVLFDLIGDKQGQVDHLALIKQAFKSPAFFKAAIVSPLIMFAIYGLIKSVPDNTVAFMIAFQNGFFWLSAFNKIKKENPDATPTGTHKNLAANKQVKHAETV